ncbi:MAG: hypothetical protein LBQ58_09425 [Synergistaceae bacterium]|nr:hypothetical protein [Synergistaceae bacterium]
MRGLLILILILIAIFFMMPIILGVFLVLICTAFVFILLARLGLLPAGSFKTYTYTYSPFETQDSVREGRHSRKNINFEDEERDWRENRDGWYGSAQEGEIINLPETALKKDDDPDSQAG